MARLAGRARGTVEEIEENAYRTASIGYAEE